MILAHVRQGSELPAMSFPSKEFEFSYDIKNGVKGLSLACRQWSQVLRPFLFRYLWLRRRSDIQFLLSVVRSPRSAWLAGHISVIRLDMSEKKGASPIRLSSSVWRDIRAAAPALHTLEFDSVTGQMFPWQQRAGLDTLTTVRHIRISNFCFPSFSSLLRLISNASSLECVALLGIRWRGSEFDTPHGYSTPFSNLKHATFL